MRTNEAVAVEARDPARTERLVAALKVLAEDAGVLLAATSDQTGQQIAQARATVDESLAKALACIGDAPSMALAQTRSLGQATASYVRAHRWEVLAGSAALGFVLGALLGRSRAPQA